MRYYAVAILFLTSIVSCEIDNYDEPQLTLSGEIIDNETNELVESGGNNGGTLLKLYESTSPQPLIYKTFPDGTFKNSKVFAGKYRITVEGPFEIVSQDTLYVEIKRDTLIEFKVIPNVRLETTVEKVNGTTAKIKVIYQVNSEQEFVDIGLIWSTYKNPNIFTFSGGSSILEDASTLTDSVSGEKEFVIENLNPGKTYYIRACASINNSSNYYNYSTQIKLEL